MRRAQATPRIQPQAKGKLLTYSFRIDSETQNQLSAYAEFISSDPSHVIREALRLLFQGDRSFQSHLGKWNRIEHDSQAGSIVF